MGKFDQAKMLLQMRKVQKELSKMTVSVEKGDGAVKIEVTGEQKVKRVHLDESKINKDDFDQLELWLEEAIREAFKEAQEKAADKMKPFMGMLGDLGM